MLIPLFASVAPFLLWPVEFLFPYPHIVEELVKLLIVFFILKSLNKKTMIILAILAGIFFAFSESVLYISNIMLVGTPWTFIERLIITTPLHVVTILLILFSGMWSRIFLPLGVAAAMILHFFFNLFVAGL